MRGIIEALFSLERPLSLAAETLLHAFRALTLIMLSLCRYLTTHGDSVSRKPQPEMGMTSSQVIGVRCSAWLCQWRLPSITPTLPADTAFTRAFSPGLLAAGQQAAADDSATDAQAILPSHPNLSGAHLAGFRWPSWRLKWSAIRFGIFDTPRHKF